jgi:hypothetical protein
MIRTDYTNVDRDYLKAEIAVRKTPQQMRDEIVNDSYLHFKEDIVQHLTSMNIFKSRMQASNMLRTKDALPQHQEQWLIMYMKAYYEAMPDEEVAREYLERVIRNNTVHYE